MTMENASDTRQFLNAFPRDSVLFYNIYYFFFF